MPEAYAAGSPECLATVSGERRMSGTRCPWCAVSLIPEAYAAGSPKRLAAVCGAHNAGCSESECRAVRPQPRSRLRRSRAGLLPVATPETARRHTNRAVNPLM